MFLTHQGCTPASHTELPTVQADERGSGRILAYLPTTHTFRLVLRDRLDQEHLGTIQIDRDRFCNVVQAAVPRNGDCR